MTRSRGSGCGRVCGGLAAGIAFSLLASCAGVDRASKGIGRSIGPAYQVNGVWYEPRHQPGYDQTGVASWYGSGFHGRRTASGEIYDMEAMTAAHTTLPLGSRVRVTNLQNSRTVDLIINDRGPFVDGRIIDVSQAAARKLGLLATGTAPVRVLVLDSAGPRGTRIVKAHTEGHNSDLFQAALNAALESRSAGVPHAWGDAAQGAHGVIIPLTNPTVQSSPRCRNYRHTTIGAAGDIVHIGRACRQPDGAWRIVRERPASTLPAS